MVRFAAIRGVGTMECDHCQTADAKLYWLPASYATRKPGQLGVCYFCFIRLVRRSPRRSELALAVEPAAG